MRPILLALVLCATACAVPATEMVACPAQGCAKLDPPSALDQALLEHAEFDLQCSRTELDIKNVDQTTSWVCGCGRTARYAWIGQRLLPGRWLLDSPVMVAARR